MPLVDKILFWEAEALCRFHTSENVVIFDSEWIHFDPILAIVVEVGRDRSLDVVLCGRAAVGVPEAKTSCTSRRIIFVGEVVSKI